MVRRASTESFERIEGDLLDQLSLDAVYGCGMISYRFAHDVSVGTASITFGPWYGWDPRRRGRVRRCSDQPERRRRGRRHQGAIIVEYVQ